MTIAELVEKLLTMPQHAVVTRLDADGETVIPVQNACLYGTPEFTDEAGAEFVTIE